MARGPEDLLGRTVRNAGSLSYSRTMVKIERIYASPTASDGYRVLVDRLWPRGVSKERAALDLWLKDVAPSSDLRRWFGHDPARFDEFADRYRSELAVNPALAQLRDIVASHDTVTLLFGAKDETHNEAVVLQQLVQESID